jgi:hypothetical protein
MAKFVTDGKPFASNARTGINRDYRFVARSQNPSCAAIQSSIAYDRPAVEGDRLQVDLMWLGDPKLG